MSYNPAAGTPIATAMASWAGASGNIDVPTGFVPKVAIVIQGNNFNAGNSGVSVGFATGVPAAQQADMADGQCDSSALATGFTGVGEIMRYLTSCVGTISVGVITQFDSTRVRLNLSGVCSGSILVFG